MVSRKAGNLCQLMQNAHQLPLEGADFEETKKRKISICGIFYCIISREKWAYKPPMVTMVILSTFFEKFESLS